MKGLRLLLIIACFCAGVYYFTYQTSSMNEVQESLADKIIRFHIRANSDSDDDQELKLIVRDAVCDYMDEKLGESESIDETRNIINDEMNNIITVATQALASAGYDYTVNAYFEESYFPLKTYGDMTFPPGIYEAFRIDIGEAKGHNWWCVMYPPLCFLESTYGVVPNDSKERLKNILSEEEYDAITLKNAEPEEIDIEFKVVEFFRGL